MRCFKIGKIIIGMLLIVLFIAAACSISSCGLYGKKILDPPATVPPEK